MGALCGQDDLAEGTRLHDGRVRFGGVGHRDLASDEGSQRARGQAGHDGRVDGGQLGRRNVEERHAEDCGIAAHGGPRIDLDSTTTAHHHYASATAQHRQIAIEVDVRGHLENYIHATSTCCFHDGVDIGGVLV